MSKQPWSRQSTVDRPCRSRRLDNTFAGVTCERGPHVTNHLVGCRDALQLFRDVFTELAQRTAAIGTAVVRGKMGDYFPRKISWKRLAFRRERRFESAGVARGCAASAAACPASSAARAVSSSSRRNSSCSSCPVSFSLFLPKIIRRYFSMTSFRCSISYVLDVSSLYC